jgi:hypothetical protein
MEEQNVRSPTWASRLNSQVAQSYVNRQLHISVDTDTDTVGTDTAVIISQGPDGRVTWGKVLRAHRGYPQTGCAIT